MPEPVELLSELLERCRAGDTQASARLVQRFYGYARSLAVALTEDRHSAEDVVQNAMLSTLSRLGELREPEAFAGWLRQIVRSEAARIRRRKSSTELAPECPDDRASPLDQVQLDELRRQVRSALAGLPPAGQQTAQLYYLDELDQSQIADELDVPLGTVKRRLHDARERLRELLKDQRPRGRDLPL